MKSRQLELIEMTPDFAMLDEDFQALMEYHLHTCEKRELLGNQQHLLHICRKTEKDAIR